MSAKKLTASAVGGTSPWGTFAPQTPGLYPQMKISGVVTDAIYLYFMGTGRVLIFLTNCDPWPVRRQTYTACSHRRHGRDKTVLLRLPSEPLTLVRRTRV